jgi:hypothetical protein
MQVAAQVLAQPVWGPVQCKAGTRGRQLGGTAGCKGQSPCKGLLFKVRQVHGANLPTELNPKQNQATVGGISDVENLVAGIWGRER